MWQASLSKAASERSKTRTDETQRVDRDLYCLAPVPVHRSGEQLEAGAEYF